MRMRLVFPALLVGTLVLGAAASAQAVPAAWDVIVTVRRDHVGGDLVTVGPRMATYPADLLRSQILALGERLGSEARGITLVREEIRPGDASATVLRGSCGVNGLIGRTNGSLAVAPIAQAFAGAPAPYTVHRLLVSFDGEVPGPRTVAYHTVGPGSDLAFVGRRVGSSIEYDVDLRSQNPSRLVIHENVPPTVAAKSPSRRLDAATVALFAIAAVAAGALVYCVLLLVGRRPLAKS